MNGRPQKASDEAIFAAATRAMARRGPVELTLADIAAEAGLTAGALVQRFGSKRGLLLAIMAQFAASAPAMLEGLKASARSPLAAIRAYARCMAGLGASPEAVARSFSWLTHDLTDPDFRRHLLVQARGVRRELERLLREAVEAGELSPSVGPAALARAVEVAISGSLMTWAIYQEGAAVSWVRRDLDAVLRPWLVGGGARAERPPKLRARAR